MLTDHLSLGPVPADEDCQQVGTPNYSASEAKKECYRFIDLIRSTFGYEPEGAELRITNNIHEFGCYHDVEVFYDPEIEKAVEYAYMVEEKAPLRWDD